LVYKFVTAVEAVVAVVPSAAVAEEAILDALFDSVSSTAARELEKVVQESAASLSVFVTDISAGLAYRILPALATRFQTIKLPIFTDFATFPVGG
jgi:hypothetical protein